jgi:hypothetical protein
MPETNGAAFTRACAAKECKRALPSAPHNVVKGDDTEFFVRGALLYCTSETFPLMNVTFKSL